jgi:uncharacterized membrane protein
LISPFNNNTDALNSFRQATIFDILLALFGGMAGFIGVLKKEGTRVIAGVAVATACMPPLCTAGFGLAHADWVTFLGGLYFFLINCLFIGCGTFLLARMAGFHVTKQPYVEKNTSIFLWWTLIVIMLVPASYIAFQKWKQERKTATATTTPEQRIEQLEKKVQQLDSLLRSK